MWHNGEARDRESADVMLAVMKTLANLDAKERRKKQEGKFGAMFDGNKFMCRVDAPGRRQRRARRRHAAVRQGPAAQLRRPRHAGGH